MLKVLNFCNSKTDLSLLNDSFMSAVAFEGDDYTDIRSVQTLDAYVNEYLKTDDLDISCFDITADKDGQTLDNIRKKKSEVLLVVVADNTISPLKYMRPNIKASSLLLKPVTNENAQMCVRELIKSYYESNTVRSDKKYCVDTKEGKRYFRLDDVVYFEARDKKIYLNTQFNEAGFYSTLDEIEETLPENFIRCHRGFIVNLDKIVQVLPAQNSIICIGDMFVPLSRGCKTAVMDALERINNG